MIKYLKIYMWSFTRSYFSDLKFKPLVLLYSAGEVAYFFWTNYTKSGETRRRVVTDFKALVMETTQIVKDVSLHEFVKAYSAHFERSG